MLAHFISAQVPFAFSEEYNMYLPAGERQAHKVYDYLGYVRQIKNDLLHNGLWDRMCAMHGTSNVIARLPHVLR